MKKHKEQKTKDKVQPRTTTAIPANLLRDTPLKKTTAIIQFKKNKMTNSDAPQNYPGDDQNLQNEDPNNKGQQKASSPAGDPITGNAEPHYPDDLSTDQTSNPYDSDNFIKESESESKDINEKDTQEDLKDNDPSEGIEIQTDTPKDDEFESGQFQRSGLDQIQIPRKFSLHK